MALPIVAVVGRPNVGKSTLVNRLAQAQDAIVHAQSGVTRDRSYHRADWNGREFMLVDTGGIEFQSADEFGDSIRQQALVGAEEADIVLFVVDGRTGPTGADQEVSRILQRAKKPVFLLVNKMDTPNVEDAVHEFWSLGLGQPLAVSALHGHGTGDFLDALVEALPGLEGAEESADLDIAIIGKPNAGKSSLFNKLVGAERTIVSEVAGTTRDAIDTVIVRDDVRYRLIDTAGLRRKSQIDESVEYYGFVRAMRAIDRADVALLVIDSMAGITDQDQRVASFAEERGCALVILLNKWDLMKDEDQREELLWQVENKLGFVSFAEHIRISALRGSGMDKLFRAVDRAYASYTQTISTSHLNRFLTDIRTTGHTISKQARTLRLQYVTQTRSKPPGFVFFANHPTLVDDSYRRYLENRMREAFDFTGSPITLKFRQKG